MDHKLSKSKYIRGLQCVKALYYDVYNPKLARYSAETLALFNRGRRFEQAYKALFENGIDVSAMCRFNPLRSPGITANLLASSSEVTLFEAGFIYDGVLILADVVRKTAAGSLHVHEVKSGIDVTPTFRRDAAVQHYVVSHAIEGSGLRLSEFSVIYNGGDEGFLKLDLTDECQAEHAEIEANIARFKDVLQGFEPQVPMGPQCSSPYECPYQHHCKKLLV
ncbi:MAG: hypothetical protein K5650_07130 [Bacteroidales bacterium]|nr:hypothetical protein [Bacteroidales bacterium]